MRLLVLGGTQFLSRAVAAEAARRGHDVVCANRGRSGAAPPGVSTVRWDREEPAPAELTDGESYDAVVDVARVPSHVRRALTALRDAHSPGAHWVFVSTISVYADDADPAGPGAGRLKEAVIDDRDPMASVENYGGMKVACERLVLDSVPNAAVVRPGLIVGPGDPSGRLAYWARRSTSTGEVLAPGDPADLVQVIDVRDLAAWIVTLAEERTGGTYDAVGPALPVGDLLAACLPDADLVWVDQDFLEAEGVEPWSGPDSVPVWLPRPAYDGMLAHDAAPALAAGLTPRPVDATTRDTRAWLDADPAARITGITIEREADLLARWRDR
ncbi:NAD-dependent epimerase/dehydratase family protein [Nocardioides carbamazepini]|uniref:NAD-dependent epimerase/dehydratase family protein n=1 Tax=Nocardioides carbamazepini TaxID=2854259 RepID=UPI00214A16CB|nr:NAD-dependent epimerase/dehydratase family protein [Nocardioides carbamazepini]MCR1781103.1 NAD-dependent epimerase/dehydratase family protein [Nocardioides carbamazepini]